jgi:hypothetical protein
MFAAVGRLGSDRTYAAAAVTRNGCTTRLYRFTIDARGRPSGLTPLSVPQVTGAVGELVGSADGNVLAYTASGPCAPRAHTPVGVIHLATRQVTTWTFQSARPRWFNGHKYWQPSATVGSVSLTTDGSLLGFLAGPDRRDGPQDVWVLPTSSPPGPLTQNARKVLHLGTGVFRVLLSNSGSRAYVETQSAPRGGAVVLGLYSTSTGKRIRLLGRLGPGGRNLAELPITVDAAGQHLLAYGYLGSARVTVINLPTGRRASTRAAHLVVEGHSRPSPGEHPAKAGLVPPSGLSQGCCPQLRGTSERRAVLSDDWRWRVPGLAVCPWNNEIVLVGAEYASEGPRAEGARY